MVGQAPAREFPALLQCYARMKYVLQLHPAQKPPSLTRSCRTFNALLGKCCPCLMVLRALAGVLGTEGISGLRLIARFHAQVASTSGQLNGDSGNGAHPGSEPGLPRLPSSPPPLPSCPSPSLTGLELTDTHDSMQHASTAEVHSPGHPSPPLTTSALATVHDILLERSAYLCPNTVCPSDAGEAKRGGRGCPLLSVRRIQCEPAQGGQQQPGPQSPAESVREPPVWRARPQRNSRTAEGPRLDEDSIGEGQESDEIKEGIPRW